MYTDTHTIRTGVGDALVENTLPAAVVYLARSYMSSIWRWKCLRSCGRLLLNVGVSSPFSRLNGSAHR